MSVPGAWNGHQSMSVPGRLADILDISRSMPAGHSPSSLYLSVTRWDLKSDLIVDPHFPCGGLGSTMVDVGTQCSDGSSHNPQGSKRTFFHGCVEHRLGCALELLDGLWCLEVTPHVPEQQDSATSTSHFRENECFCGFLISPNSDVRYRVVSTSFCVLSSHTRVRNHIAGFIRNEVEPQNSSILVPIPDPSAMAVGWKAMWAYVYPPAALLPQVLEKVQ